MEASSVVSGAAPVAKGIFEEVKRHMTHVIIYKENVKNFEEKLKTLIAKRTRVQQEVDEAVRNGEKIKADVEHWREKVDDVIEEEEKKVKDLQDKAKSKCFIGLCPNLKSRYNLSRKAEDDAIAFEKLIGQSFNGPVGYHDVLKMDTSEPSKDFVAFQSREKVFNDLMEALKDDILSIIGVYGIGGVGKTFLVKEVARQAQQAKLFDTVVLVDVPRTKGDVDADIQNIQDHVAEMLGLKLVDKTTKLRARRLYHRLKNEEKILVVLDNIWVKLDLEEVGIPFGNKNKGVKLLLTVRDQNVLSHGVEGEKAFEVGLLDEDEAWQLFKKMAGNDVESADLQSTAVEIAKICARLPVAISTVASSLRNKSSNFWQNALRELKRPSAENFTGRESKNVYSVIRLSYDHLEREELKQIFLLCSLLRRRSIDHLLRRAIGLGLIHRVNSVKEARVKLLTMVIELKEACLLLDSNKGDRYFDIHDIVRDVAISIASKDNQVFALRREDNLQDWPDAEEMKMCNKIFFEYPTISELPDELNCPQLVFFVMSCKDRSLKIPTNFFRETTKLRVLDLAEMNLSSLPSSISLPTCLRTLSLHLSKLGDIANIVKDLKNLEILSLAESDIRILPKEIGLLVKLKVLELSHCTKLTIIPQGILPRLSRLEELHMGHTSIQWAAEEYANQGSNASLAELKTLSSLNNLEVQIPDANAIQRDLFDGKLQKLERYKIFIGKEWEWFGEEYSRTLRLSLSTSMDDLDHGIKRLLKTTEDLYLDELKGVKIAMHNLKLYGGSLEHLKNLHIQNGLEIKYIIDGNDLSDDKVEFPQLQSLTLQGLPELVSFCSEDERGSTSIPQPNLSPFRKKVLFPRLESLQLSSINVERIWSNQLSNISMCTHENLSMLTIEGCENLKHLLSIGMARRLVHLKYFEVVRCQSLREIIFTEDIVEENKAEILFPQLDSLKIRDLQHLIAFCSEDYNVDFQSLKLLNIENCPELKGFIYKSMEGNQDFSPQALFDEKVSFPSLEEMRISNLKNMKIIWQNQLPRNSFSRLRGLDVRGCDILSTIFPSNTLTTFQSLQTLCVNGCASLEQVFEVGSVNMDELPNSLTSQLTKLSLIELPNLKYIWRKDPHGDLTFHNLRMVHVCRCWNLKNIFPASVARALKQLRELKLFYSGVEEIVSKDEGLTREAITTIFEFNQVSSLTLWYLPELTCFYPGVHTTNWPMLRRLKVFGCYKMKIFGTENRLGSNMPWLISAEKVILELEKLSLNSEDIAVISAGQLSRTFFDGIKGLRLVSCRGESATFPISLLERSPNLEKLYVVHCDFTELFPSGGDVGKPSKIRHLKLGGLHKLTYIWKEDVQVDQILPNLETLRVSYCDNLISLGSSSASFQNLTTLDVWRCKGMMILVTSSTVQCLLQLKTFVIRECSMKEIVGNQGDEGTKEIVLFSKLKSLQLWDLPQLKSFCSGDLTFEFPALEQVIVGKCPHLEVFCKGILKAPKVEQVQVTYDNDRRHWDGDLNTTVQQMLAKKVGYQGVENLVLSKLFESIEIWRKSVQGVLDFRNLTHVEVFGCENFKYIFTASMALALLQCKEIKVKNCPVLKHIITNEGAEEAEKGAIMLPRLNTIVIESCSNLTSFCAASITVDCPSLGYIDVIECPKMFAFVSTFPREQEIERVGGGENDTKSFLNDKVLCPNLWYLRLQSTNIQNLLPAKQEVTCSNVLNLKSLFVIGCHNLKHLFPSCLIKDFVKLKGLLIHNCNNMEEVIYREEYLEEGEGITQMLFPELEQLALTLLPKLERFFRGDNSESDNLALFNEKVAFPRLNCLQIVGMGNWKEIWDDKAIIINSFCELNSLMVKDCGRLFNVFPVNMMERHEKLETVYIENCEALEEIIGHHGLNFTESHGVTANGLTEDKSITQFLFPKMRSLTLVKLPKLKSFYSILDLENSLGSLAPVRELGLLELPELTHLWKQEIPPGEVFNDLRNLEGSACGKLKNLLPSSVSLKNLTTLEVSECHGLTSLVTHTTAKSLVLLTRMSITDCKLLEEIMASSGDQVTGGIIIFSQLKSLELGCLPSLSSFCSGNYTIECPSLEEVIIRQCPKMEIFSKGELRTPMLLGIQSRKGEYVGCWEGDLNVFVKKTTQRWPPQLLFSMERMLKGMQWLFWSSLNRSRISQVQQYKSIIKIIMFSIVAFIFLVGIFAYLRIAIF